MYTKFLKYQLYHRSGTRRCGLQSATKKIDGTLMINVLGDSLKNGDWVHGKKSFILLWQTRIEQENIEGRSVLVGDFTPEAVDRGYSSSLSSSLSNSFSIWHILLPSSPICVVERSLSISSRVIGSTEGLKAFTVGDKSSLFVDAGWCCEWKYSRTKRYQPLQKKPRTVNYCFCVENMEYFHEPNVELNAL